MTQWFYNSAMDSPALASSCFDISFIHSKELINFSYFHMHCLTFDMETIILHTFQKLFIILLHLLVGIFFLHIYFAALQENIELLPPFLWNNLFINQIGTPLLFPCLSLYTIDIPSLWLYFKCQSNLTCAVPTMHKPCSGSVNYASASNWSPEAVKGSSVS